MTSISILKSKVKFHSDLTEMPFKELITEITDDIINNYEIVHLDINKVLNNIKGGQDYKKFENDKKMSGLISFIKEGNKLIPPIIRNINDNNWTIFDGQHRIGLFLHLNIVTIPFLIKKDQMKYIQQLK